MRFLWDKSENCVWMQARQEQIFGKSTVWMAFAQSHRTLIHSHTHACGYTSKYNGCDGRRKLCFKSTPRRRRSLACYSFHSVFFLARCSLSLLLFPLLLTLSRYDSFFLFSDVKCFFLVHYVYACDFSV